MTQQQKRLWNSMIRQSFEPRQWFEDEEGPKDYYQEGARTMWVFRKTDAGYTVGFYDPEKNWHAESDHPTKSQAAQRVNWLNGGRASPELQAATERGFSNS